MKNVRKEVCIYAFSVLIMFLMIYYVAYQVPMHSDDYGYAMQGLSFETHLNHYKGWSGRFITDYTSSILFTLFSKKVYMAINSLVFLCVMVISSILPNIIRKRKIVEKGTTGTLWLIFMLYWVANPNLGQTSFWLVGSANYLWPLMWGSMYFACLLFFLGREKRGIVFYLLIFFLGIFAGLSNEGFGLCVVIFTICMLFVYKFSWFWFAGFVSSSVGYSLLLFAPGNRARLTNGGFEMWKSFTFVDKIIYHVFGRMSDALGRLFLVYIISILLLLAVVLFRNGKEVEIRHILFILFFWGLSVCSVLAFIASPAMPQRSENTCLYFALLALSYIGSMVMDCEYVKAVGALALSLVITLAYFIPSYSFVAYAYTQAKVQSEIREQIIGEAINAGAEGTIIPDWFFTRLIKEEDEFDTFRPLEPMATYYGMSYIDWNDVTFNYAIIQQRAPIAVNIPLKDDLVLENVFIKNKAPFEQTFALEFNRNIMNYIQADEPVLYIHLNVEGRDEYVNADVSVGRFIQVGDKYYYGGTLFYPNIEKMESISVGFLNPDTGTSSVETEIVLKDYE